MGSSFATLRKGQKPKTPNPVWHFAEKNILDAILLLVLIDDPVRSEYNGQSFQCMKRVSKEWCDSVNKVYFYLCIDLTNSSLEKNSLSESILLLGKKCTRLEYAVNSSFEEEFANTYKFSFASMIAFAKLQSCLINNSSARSLLQEGT